MVKIKQETKETKNNNNILTNKRGKKYSDKIHVIAVIT